MRKFFTKYFPIIPVALVLGSMMFHQSCANTTQAPTGGKKDTIPPVIVDISPLPGTVNVPTKGTKIRITFDEYVTVKDVKSIFLSPPLEKMPKYRMNGKTLIVYFESDLDSNTTYTLDLTNAIADNNEGNMYPGYTLAFSTGDSIDSMALTGTVLDCNTLQPIQGATVLIYKDLSDSAIFKHRPDAAVKTDAWGFFALRNIADTDYRLYAINDAQSNNVYDPANDKIAFVDSIIHPTLVSSDTLPELMKYDMEDTLNCMARNSQYEMVMFTEITAKQMVKDYKRMTPRSAYISFMARDAKIDSLWIRGFSQSKMITQFNPERDSLELWINDRRKMPDTLHVFVDYLKTDTNNVLSPFTEHLKLTLEGGKAASKSSRRDLKHEDTTCVITVTATPENIEQYGYQLEFANPIIYENFDSVTLTSINPKQQESPMKFTVTRDSTNLRKYSLMPEGKLQTGYDYVLKIPHRAFRDVNGFYSDSTETKVSLPKDDKLSSLALDLTGVRHRYFVDLLNDTRNKVLRNFVVTADTRLVFPYLKAGKYSIRITEDLNGNGLVDTGSLLDHKQPEKVKFFKLKDGSYVLNVAESTELEQKIDIGKLFSD